MQAQLRVNNIVRSNVSTGRRLARFRVNIASVKIENHRKNQTVPQPCVSTTREEKRARVWGRRFLCLQIPLMTPKPSSENQPLRHIFVQTHLFSVIHGTYLLTYIYDIIIISLYEILSGIRVSKSTAVKKSNSRAFHRLSRRSLFFPCSRPAHRPILWYDFRQVSGSKKLPTLVE